MDNPPPVKGPKAVRSPGYPILDLEDALGRARSLYTYARRNAVPVDAALKVWGYAHKSGGGLQQLAALIKYGLLADEGSRDDRTVRLTERAFDIILDERAQSPKRATAIRDAALAPSIHSEIHERWDGALPDDDHLKHWLVRERAFNDTSVPGFVKQLRATFAFAKLETSGTMEDTPDDRGGKPDEHDVDTDTLKKPNHGKRSDTPLPLEGTFPLPVLMDDGSYSLVHLPRMTEAAFELLKKQLEVYKAAFVVKSVPTPSNDSHP